MAQLIEWTFNEYPGFSVTVITHPNGLMTALMKRHGNPIARTKVPTEGGRHCNVGAGHTFDKYCWRNRRMIPKLSDVILSQMQRMLEVMTKPQIILHTDTGELEIKPGWLSPDAEANFNYLKEEYLKAIYMEAEFNNANSNSQAP